MTTSEITGPRGPVPIYLATPAGTGPWPGVVVIHDALGMTEDVRDQARWLAASGYLAAAPDLYHRGGRLRCLVKAMRAMAKGVEGPVFDDIDAVRGWLCEHPQGTGKVGIIGFCFGGGFALMLAPGHGYAVSAVNYGGMTERDWRRMAQACPIVASYGGADPTLPGMATRLESVLAEYGVAHDIKEYAGVGHGFMNRHTAADGNWLFSLLGRLANTRYDAAATEDARGRIIRFFASHLHTGPAPVGRKNQGG